MDKARIVETMHETDRPLIVDRAAASQTLDDDELRAWARDQRVFVSSVMEELRDERRALADRIDALGAEPVLFERFGGREDDAEVAYLHEVATSSIYIGLLGRRYGRPLSSRFSATHAEYREAEGRGLRVAVWAKDIDDREGPAESFLQEVRAFHTTGTFRTTDELAGDVERRVRRIAAEDLAPWVKLGPVVFRARTILDARDRIEVEARVRDRDVLSALEALAPDRWGRAAETMLAYAGRARPASVEDLALTTRAGSGSDVRVALAATEVRTDPVFEISVSDGGRMYSPGDLTEFGLRHELFGEPLPTGGLAKSMASFSNPLRPLGGAGLSEEIVRPVAHLLLTEALVGHGRASRITRMRIGLPVAGRRAFRLAWEGPRRYPDLPPERRSIEGVVELGS
jgi:hypothetical protein